MPAQASSTARREPRGAAIRPTSWESGSYARVMKSYRYCMHEVGVTGLVWVGNAPGYFEEDDAVVGFIVADKCEG